MNTSKTNDLAYVVLGGTVLVLILLGILVLGNDANLRDAHASREQNSGQLSTDQFWQMLPS